MAANKNITSHGLQIILESNKKATEIYLETEQQNEEILKVLQELKIKIDSVDTYLFKLTLTLSALGITTIIELVKLFK